MFSCASIRQAEQRTKATNTLCLHLRARTQRHEKQGACESTYPERPWGQSFAPLAQMLGRSESYDAVIPLESCTDIPTSMYVRVTTVDAAEGVLQGFITGVDCRLPQW